MSRNQGFELEKNLSESVSDGSALDNLGGGNISADITLFRNNTKNTSELIWKYSVEGSFISNNKFIFPRSDLFIFTNNDEVKVDLPRNASAGDDLGGLNSNTTYYVVEYEENLGSENNQLAFGLSTTKGGSKVNIGSVTNGIRFIRNDEVTFNNILNIATPETLNEENELETDRAFSFNIGSSFDDAFNTINSNIDLFGFLRREKYTIDASVNSDNQVRIEGAISINDPAATNINNGALGRENSPGLYITNPFSPNGVLGIEKTRAGSTSQNPWTDIGKLVTPSAEVNIGDLFFESGIIIDDFDDVNNESGDTALPQNFTHKLPITINGIEYFVLLKQ